MKPYLIAFGVVLAILGCAWNHLPSFRWRHVAYGAGRFDESLGHFYMTELRGPALLWADGGTIWMWQRDGVIWRYDVLDFTQVSDGWRWRLEAR